MLRRGDRSQETPSIFHKAAVRLLYQLPVWRATANEDVCLAIACACWFAENPVSAGWPSASESEHANGDGNGRRTVAVHAGEQDTSLVWRDPANEDVCVAVACGCWLVAACHRRLAIGFRKRRCIRGRNRRRTAAANARGQKTSQVWRETANEDLCLTQTAARRQASRWHLPRCVGLWYCSCCVPCC
jgi:hypothetical protein